MSKLLIEQLMEEVEKTASETSETPTEETTVEKTAEELGMEKIAHEINVLDQSRTLVAIGEEMYKIACELENEGLKALAADTYHVGERMGSCLTKTASEDGSALEEALEIAEDMHKIASVYADLADEVKDDETLNKMAEAIIAISNELTDDANEVYAQLEKEAASEFHNTQKSEGFNTAKIWKARGIGATALGALGAAGGAAVAGKKGALAGAVLGALEGTGVGEGVSRYKQVKIYYRLEARDSF